MVFNVIHMVNVVFYLYKLSISMKCWKWPPVILIIKNHEILLWLFYFSIHLSSQLLSLYVSVRLSVFLRLSEREPCERATACWAWTVLLWTDRNMLTLWPWSCRAAKRLSSSSSTTSWSWVSRHTDAHVHARVWWKERYSHVALIRGETYSTSL